MRNFLVKTFVALVALVSSVSFAQKVNQGKVTVEMLQQKQHPTDTSASAAVLFKKGSTILEYVRQEGFRMVTECTERIKIYKKDGYEHANQSIAFYTGNESEKVDINAAVTYNLVDGKIEKTKLKSEGEFVEKANKFWSRKRIAMPNVRVGSIIEFTYRISSPYFQNMPNWDFQEEIPVDYAEFETDIPEYFDYQVHLKGALKPEMSKNAIRRHYEDKTHEKSQFTGVTKDEAYSVDYTDNIAIYTMKNVPALRDEQYVNNISNYTSSLAHELSSVRNPNGKTSLYATDWESVARTIYQSDDFGAELARTGYFESDVDMAVNGKADERQKATAIFYLVRNTMTWNGLYGYYCDKGVKKAYKEKTGNTAEINLMLTAMLRAAGLKANPVLISTRSNGISIFPALSSFNHVIVEVEVDGKSVLLDATDKSAGFDLLPRRDLNWFGRVIRKDASSDLIDLMPKNKSREVVNVVAAIHPQGKYVGQLKHQYFEHNGLEYRDAYAKEKEENYLEMLEKRNSGCVISQFKREFESEGEKPISESYAFEYASSVEVIGDRIYISPMAFLAMRSNPFKQQTRDYPVDFVYPNQEKYNITLALPDGYAIESLPAVLNLGTPDNFGSFKYVIQAKDKSVQIAVTYDMNEAIVPADYYDVLRDFYQKMVDKQNEKIVLKKI